MISLAKFGCSIVAVYFGARVAIGLGPVSAGEKQLLTIARAIVGQGTHAELLAAEGAYFRLNNVRSAAAVE